MKTFSAFLFSSLVATSALSAQTTNLETMRGAKIRERKPAQSTLVVGVNESVGSIVEPGWPLIVSALLTSEITPPPSPPADMRLAMTDERDREVPITLQAVARPSGITGEQGLYWLAAESATRGLAPGLYRVKVVSPSTQESGIKFESGNLRVVSANAERRNQLATLRIQRFLLLGRDDEALAEADRAIAADPKDEDLWIAKGDIFMQKDMPDDALEAYDSALKLHKKGDREPLAIATRRRAAFFRSLEKRGVGSPQPTPP